MVDASNWKHLRSTFGWMDNTHTLTSCVLLTETFGTLEPSMLLFCDSTHGNQPHRTHIRHTECISILTIMNHDYNVSRGWSLKNIRDFRMWGHLRAANSHQKNIDSNKGKCRPGKRKGWLNVIRSIATESSICSTRISHAVYSLSYEQCGSSPLWNISISHFR